MVPGEVPDQTAEGGSVSPMEVIDLHLKLAYRTQSVLMALKQAGIPFTRLTREALDQASETLESVCSIYDPQYEDEE